MTTSRGKVLDLNQHLVRLARDFLLTLTMFVAIAALIGVEPSGAVPAIKFESVQTGSIGLISLPVHQDFARSAGLAGTATWTQLITFAIAVSLTIAFNLAVLRYLRRAYASPRRGRWGRE